MFKIKQKIQSVRIVGSMLVLPLALALVLTCMISPAQVFAAINVGGSQLSGCSAGAGIALTGTSDSVIRSAACLLEQAVVPLLFAMAAAVFVWGVVKFIGTQESAEREKGKQFMVWGIVALAVMFCVWGLVRVLGGTFGVNSVIPQLPQ